MSRYLRLCALLAVVVACTPSVGGSFLPVATAAQAAACEGVDGWRCPKLARPTLVKAGNQPIIPASWTVGTWFVDPANGTGTASDHNDCTTGSTACVTWQEIAVHRWGTESPRLRQDTAIHFLSNQPATDPVYLTPYLENGANFSVQCTRTSVGSGNLSGTVAKNRGSDTLLRSTLVGGLAVGQLIVNGNGAHAGEAFLYANAGGNVWKLTQPLTVATVPVTFASEVNSWADTDAFTVYSLSNINLVRFRPNYSGMGNTFTNQASVTNCNIIDPSGAQADQFYLGADVSYLQDVSSQRAVVSEVDFNNNVFGGNTFQNVDFAAGGIIAGVAGTGHQILGGMLLNGGIPGGFTVNQTSFGGDVIINSDTFAQDIDGGGYVSVYVETGHKLVWTSGSIQSAGAGSSFIWGPGSMDVQGRTRFTYPAGANQAAAVLLMGTLTINGQTKACKATPGGASSFGTCNITVNTTNLDGNLGTTDGCLAVGGGAAICNGNL